MTVGWAPIVGARRVLVVAVAGSLIVGCSAKAGAGPSPLATSQAAVPSVAVASPHAAMPSAPALTAPPAPSPPTGQTQEYLPPVAATVPAGGSVDVPIAFEGASDAWVVVMAADGAVTARLGEVRLRPADSTLGKTLSARLTDPRDAVLTVSNDGPASARIDVLTSILTGRHVLISTSDHWVPVGGTVSFTVLVTEPQEDDMPVVEIARGTSDPSPVAITSAGAARWTGTATMAKPGAHTLFARLTGDRPRFATTEISASAGNAILGDGFAERLEDDDGDTLADALVLTPTLIIRTAGTYRVNGRLVDAAGTDVGTGGATVEAGPGTTPVDIAFDGEYIFQSGRPGPYRLTDVHVFDEKDGSSGPEDARADMGATEAYRIEQFQHAPVVFDEGSYRSKAIDADADGLFESIRFTGSVSVSVPGSYDLGAQLMAPDGTLNGMDVGYAATTITLSPGTSAFDLTFDGGPIRAAWLDGPYEIRRPSLTLRTNTRVSGLGPSSFTDPFKAAQFEAGPLPSAGSGPPMHDEPSGSHP